MTAPDKQGPIFYTRHIQQKISKDDWLTTQEILSHAVPLGYARTIHKCRCLTLKGSNKRRSKCGKVQSSVFIPYGLGRGGGQNNCLCFHMDVNWATNSLKIARQEPLRQEQSQ